MSPHLRPVHDALAEPPQPLMGGDIVLGRYEVQRTLGHGGMATVYLAKHLQTERLVALKLLDPQISADPAYVERFRREAKAAGRIRSDHVVSIHDFDTDASGSLVLVMEYLEGHSVQHAMRTGRMDPGRAMLFGRQMLEGLAAAHQAGVVHRDLKPANLFLEKTPAGLERLKILDFGISKIADTSQEELTRVGQTLGTVAYMAPEQVRGRSLTPDPRVDIYSAGVCLFVMLAGKRPIDAEDTVGLLAALIEREPLTLQQASGLLFAPALEQLIHRALRKDPAHRFQTALEMRDALLHAASTMNLTAIVTAAGAPITAEKNKSGMFGAVFKPDPTPAPQSLTGVFGPVPQVLPPTPSMPTPVSGVVSTSPVPASRVPTEVLGAIPDKQAEALLAGAAGTSATSHGSKLPIIVGLAIIGLLSLGGATAVLLRRSSNAAAEAAASAASASAAAVVASASAVASAALASSAVTSAPSTLPLATAALAEPTAVAAPSIEPGAAASNDDTAAVVASALASAQPEPTATATAEAEPLRVPTVTAAPEYPPLAPSAAAPPRPVVAPVANARPTAVAAARPVLTAPASPRPTAAPSTGRRPGRRRGIIEDAPF